MTRQLIHTIEETIGQKFVPKGEFLTLFKETEGFWGSIFDPFFGLFWPKKAVCAAKRPKSPLFLGTFAGIGLLAIPARTVFWLFFPKNGPKDDLGPPSL